MVTKFGLLHQQHQRYALMPSFTARPMPHRLTKTRNAPAGTLRAILGPIKPPIKKPAANGATKAHLTSPNNAKAQRGHGIRHTGDGILHRVDLDQRFLNHDAEHHEQDDPRSGAKISDVHRDCEQCDPVNQPMPFIWCKYRFPALG
jgi:hypothetical protein